MSIKRLQPFILDIPKYAHWNVITLHITYTKRYLLKYHNPSFGIYITNTYWLKMCLLIEKCVYCVKIFLLTEMYLLNEKMIIGRKIAYWMKTYLLKGHNTLGINSGSYSFDNFFSNSFFSSFKETQKTRVFSKIPICKT